MLVTMTGFDLPIEVVRQYIVSGIRLRVYRLLKSGCSNPTIGRSKHRRADG